jgi:hypothetical protein
MERTSSGQGPIARGRERKTRRMWKARLRAPMAFPTDSSVSVQFPPGDYRLRERDDTHYELYASSEFPVILRVTELQRLRASGTLVLDGSWP